jgi:hydrogenase-4 component B
MPTFSKAVIFLALAAAALPPGAAFFAEFALLRSLFFSLPSSLLFDKFFYLVIFSMVALVAGLGVFAMIRYAGIIFLGKPRTQRGEESGEPSFAGQTLPIAIAASATLLLGFASPWIFALFLGEAVTVFGKPSSLSSFLTFGFTGISILMCAIVAFAYLLQRFVVRPQSVREVSTWDCGQPITPRMEYTGTGFAAPIRFFFLAILRSKKIITRTPIVASNPILRMTHVEFVDHNFFVEYLYTPILRVILLLRSLARTFHAGGITTYVGVMLLTVIIALIIGLWTK